MKKIYLILALLGLFNFSFGQNTVLTGNVGIGTTSPSRKLHLVGSALFAGNYDGSNNLQFATSGGSGNTWELYPQTSGFGLFNRTNNLFSFFVSNDDKFGIGTMTPTAFLNVVGNSTTLPEVRLDHYASNFGASTLQFRRAKGTQGAPSALLNGDYIMGIEGWGYNSTGFKRSTYIVTQVNGAPTAQGVPSDLIFATSAGGDDAIEGMRLDKNGNLGIGTTTPTEKLSVKGKILAQEIKVEMTGWADFVFAKDYKLPSLSEIANHIKEKGHLPGIPSAAEVQANGVELGEMNKKLLQKIEELTLHLIEQNGKIEKLEGEMKELKKSANK